MGGNGDQKVLLRRGLHGSKDRFGRDDAGLCNGFGLGGQNASLILKRFKETS